MLSLSDALEFAKFHIFGIGIHHTSLLVIWFSWTLSVLTLILVKATRDVLEVVQTHFILASILKTFPILKYGPPLDVRIRFPLYMTDVGGRRRNL